MTVQNEQKWSYGTASPGVEVLWEQWCALVLHDVFCLRVVRELM